MNYAGSVICNGRVVGIRQTARQANNTPVSNFISDDGVPIGDFLDWLMPVEVGNAAIASSSGSTFRNTTISAPTIEETLWLYINFGDIQVGRLPGEHGDWPKIRLARLYAKTRVSTTDKPSDRNSLVIPNVGSQGNTDVWLGLNSSGQIMIADNGSLQGMNFTVLRSWL